MSNLFPLIYPTIYNCAVILTRLASGLCHRLKSTDRKMQKVWEVTNIMRPKRIALASFYLSGKAD